MISVFIVSFTVNLTDEKNIWKEVVLNILKFLFKLKLFLIFY